MLVLRNWIDINKLDWSSLSLTVNAMELLENNQNKINWVHLSLNENTISLLKENQNKIDWGALCFIYK